MKYLLFLFVALIIPYSARTATSGPIRYAKDFPGSDYCAKISAAILDLPSSGGTVDATSLEGAQTCAGDPFGATSTPVTLLMGTSTTVISATWNPPIGSQIVGLGPASSIIQANSPGFILINPAKNNTISGVDVKGPFLGVYTTSTYPASKAVGNIVAIKNAADASDCTTGSGNWTNVCQWNGSAWVNYTWAGKALGENVNPGNAPNPTGSCIQAISHVAGNLTIENVVTEQCASIGVNPGINPTGTIRQLISKNNYNEGLLIPSASEGYRVEDIEASGNLSNGIDVTSGGHTFTNISAHHNGSTFSKSGDQNGFLIFAFCLRGVPTHATINDITISNLNVSANNSDGLLIEAYGQNNDDPCTGGAVTRTNISNVTAVGNGTGSGGGCYSSSCLWDGSGVAVGSWPFAGQGNGQVSNLNIANCTIDSNAGDGLKLHVSTVNGSNGQILDPKVTNCKITNNRGVGLNIISGVTNLAATGISLTGNVGGPYADNGTNSMIVLAPAGSTSTPTPLPGDVNKDNHVNVVDYVLLVSNFGQAYLSADFNNNDTVDIIDYVTLVSNFGRSQ